MENRDMVDLVNGFGCLQKRIAEIDPDSSDPYLLLMEIYKNLDVAPCCRCNGIFSKKKMIEFKSTGHFLCKKCDLLLSKSIKGGIGKSR